MFHILNFKMYHYTLAITIVFAQTQFGSIIIYFNQHYMLTYSFSLS